MGTDATDQALMEAADFQALQNAGNVKLTFPKLPLGLSCETKTTRTVVTEVEGQGVPHGIVGMEVFKVNDVEVTRLRWNATVDVIKASEFPVTLEFRPLSHDGSPSPLPSPKSSEPA